MNDLQLHVAVRDIRQPRDLIVEKVATRREVDHCETSVIYELHRKHALPCYAELAAAKPKRAGRVPRAAAADLWRAASDPCAPPSVDNMATDHQDVVMSKVRIADLRANLSRQLRKVRGGRTLTVLDGDTPIAQIVPYAAEAQLEIRPANRKPGALRLAAPPKRATDSLRLLLRDRASS